MAKTKIKICGLRRMQDIEYANMLMPDYIGFILAEGFARSITAEDAVEFSGKLDSRIKRVGVFVNQPEEMAAEYVKRGIVQYIQLHGSEDNTYICRLRQKAGKGCNIIKAAKIKDAGDIEEAMAYKCDYLLLDAGSGVQAGGNGITFDWKLVKNINKPFFLAGGICAGNAREAVEITRPYAVDASSSMETDGFKDFNKMKEFIDVVRSL
ncbi:MAG: phosphoribosylanthranilate isomerase [Lachnospiraceae bacterium]|nr:phosphoribosylanthranilate isomerase [Lachnospiraceae bacterium]